MPDKQKKIGIGIVAVMLCALAFYFLHWVKTPVYSIKLIRDSIAQHDTVAFEKHVDLDTIYNKGFDDFIVAQSKISGDDILDNPLAAGMVQMMKPSIVSKFKTETLELMKGTDAAKNTANPQTGTQSNVPADGASQTLNQKGKMNYMSYKDASVISKESDTAIVAIALHDRLVDKDFTLKVKMSKLDDGSWKLKELTNLAEFLIEYDKAEKEKLAEIDKPIKEQVYKALQIVGFTGQKHTTGGYFPSYSLNISYSLKNSSDKNITRATAYCDFIDQQENIIKTYPLNDFLNIAKDATVSSTTIINLNEFDGPDKKLIDTDPSEIMPRIKVMSIEFVDGSKIERPTKLPAPAEKK